jgi:ubiquinol-cytochrome c reductase iron-sulfur subunit
MSKDDVKEDRRQHKSAVTKDRRRFLVAATSIIGAAGILGVAVPFVKSWNPSAKAKAAGASVKINLSKLEPGQQIIYEWRGKPIYVVRRTPEMLKRLEDDDSKLRDPLSKKSDQPAYAKNEFRSRNKEFFIVIGICTHLGCAPKYYPEVQPMYFDESWQGGYHCPCHGSKFDLAGRVYKGVPAPTNLVIPPYMFIDKFIVVIGEDGGSDNA